MYWSCPKIIYRARLYHEESIIIQSWGEYALRRVGKGYHSQPLQRGCPYLFCELTRDSPLRTVPLRSN